MARKKSGPKPSPDGESPKKRKSSSKKKLPPLPTWEEVEAAMWRMLGHESLPDQRDDSPRNRAAVLIRQALHSNDPREIVDLAKRAIAIWPDCADGHVLLAENARNPKAALDQYTLGVAAARRDLGEKAFRDAAGLFWGLLPTRPYMRALLGKGQVLWLMGRREEAVENYRELLRLNPGDNQGVRHLLATCLLELGANAELARLLEAYKDDHSAQLTYCDVLLAYRLEGDSPGVRQKLREARDRNPHVPDYLTGREPLPTHPPESFSWGDPDEAVDYTTRNLSAWRLVPGALDWLRRETAPRPSKARSAPRPRPVKGPTPAAKKSLRKLPLHPEVWQADARRMPIWVKGEGEPHRPWVMLVVGLGDGMIYRQKVVEAAPTAEMLWDFLARAMRAPSEGPPRRPEAIQVSQDERLASLIEHLEDIEVTGWPEEPLVAIDEIVRHMVSHVTGRPPVPGLIDMPRVTETMVRRFFEAAASYYRAAPWQRIGGSETIRVDCDAFESGPWHAVVIGQMGMTLGVALYDDPRSLARIRDSDFSDEENARETVALSVTYGTLDEITVADLDTAEALGLEIAASDAYPAAVRKERGLSMRPPLAWELSLLEAVLRVLPRFIETHDREDSAPQVIETETGGGTLRIELAWETDGPSR